MDPRFFAPTQHSEPARSAKTESERPRLTGQEPFVSAPARTATEGGERPGDEPSMRDLIEVAVLNILETSARGRDCAITGEVLSGQVGLVLAAHGVHISAGSSLRRVQEAIERLRASGVVIGSSSSLPRGYWLPLDSERPAEARRDLVARLAGIVRTLRHVDRALADRLQAALDFREAA